MKMGRCRLLHLQILYHIVVDCRSQLTREDPTVCVLQMGEPVPHGGSEWDSIDIDLSDSDSE